MDPTDEQLAARVAHGDEQALVVLVRRWQEPLRRYVLRRCWSCAPDVEDLLQETFVRVYRNIHAFDAGLRFSSWIFRIVHNVMVSGIRTHARQEPTVELDEALFVPHGLRTDAPLEAAEQSAAIREILQGLSPVLRDVFVLRFLEDKSYEEIGDILHRNVNTIATQVRRAREAFALAARARGLHLDRGD